MHHFARRTAGISAALSAAALLLVTGCGDDTDDNDTTLSMPMTSMSMPMSMPATTTPTATGAMTTTPGATTTDDDSPDSTTAVTPGGAQVTISGDIYDKYVASGGANGPLGAPEEAEEAGPAGGRYQDFVGGTIYEPEDGEPHIVWGEIREAWEAAGGANGALGYPTSDETDIPGGKQSTFTGGTITWVNGQIAVTTTP